jgi:ketose-bisphosphate aldolase
MSTPGRPIADIMRAAHAAGLAIPAFNIPHLPMMAGVVRALRETETFGLIAVARLEWMKFESKSLEAVAEEYGRQMDPRYTRLHLDHVPVIDEDQLTVDYRAVLRAAIRAGYDSLMVDGSRLPLDANIAATREAVELGHGAGLPVEAELGAVLGHEAGPLPPYDELFRSGKGFTDPEEARRFVKETGVDWLSVSVGNIHGAISGAAKSAQKVQARLSIPHLQQLRRTVSVPLVLHGGSGIQKSFVLEGIRNGIAKINVGTAIRQAYEAARSNAGAAEEAVFQAVKQVIVEELEVAGSARRLNPPLG